MKIKQLSANAQGIVNKEFADFFETFCAKSEKWPGMTDQQLADGIAESLLELGKRRGVGAALAQTLVYELQDRINAKLN